MGKLKINPFTGETYLQNGNQYYDISSGSVNHVGTRIGNNIYSTKSDNIYSESGNAIINKNTGEYVGRNVGSIHYLPNNTPKKTIK